MLIEPNQIQQTERRGWPESSLRGPVLRLRKTWIFLEVLMARNFRELEARMSPESRKRSDDKTQRMIQAMALDELRAARQMTQEQLAAILGVRQAAVSKLERRADMYVSTLRSVIKAMGGRLEIRAVFPDHGTVEINQFAAAKDERAASVR